MPSFSVQINWKVVGDDLTAIDYADRLRPESERFDPELYERLARPESAIALHAFSDTLIVTAEARLGNRWLMRRQLQLQYPPDADFADIEQRLIREGIFGSIERDRSGPFSATPNDPLFAAGFPTSAPDRYNRQRWAFDQLDLPDAWDLTRGSATVAIVDSGVWWDDANQRFHPELDRKLLRLSSGPGPTAARPGCRSRAAMSLSSWSTSQSPARTAPVTAPMSRPWRRPRPTTPAAAPAPARIA